jgi:two-component system chemotaxis response regulator CheY
MSKVAVTVDDSKTMRDMVAFTLKSNGFEVLEAEDGEQALEVIGDQKVDIIITDLNMPKMNGIELVRALRGKDSFKFTPILMLTTESEGSKKEEGKQAGATGWIVKPFNPDALMKIVSKVC